MFMAVANLLTITTLQSESREAIAFNSVSAYFRIGVLHFIKKQKQNKTMSVFSLETAENTNPLWNFITMSNNLDRQH